MTFWRASKGSFVMFWFGVLMTTGFINWGCNIDTCEDFKPIAWGVGAICAALAFIVTITGHDKE